MKTVWKKNLAECVRADETCQVLLHIPLDSKPLACQVQGSSICIWFEVNTEQDIVETWRVFVFGTGHPIPIRYDLKHFATVQLGGYVWHVYFDAKMLRK